MSILIAAVGAALVGVLALEVAFGLHRIYRETGRKS